MYSLTRKLSILLSFVRNKLSDHLLRGELKEDNLLQSRRGVKIAHNISKTVLKKTNGYVFAGPFSNMMLCEDSLISKSQPSITIGSYEEELHAIINKTIANPPKKIIDIGSSLGFYIVGFALNTIDTDIIGFESIETYRKESIQLAKLNKVEDRISFLGHCDEEALRSVSSSSDTFILCDIEGGEKELLNPDKIPELKRCTILTELHEFYSPGVTTTLIQRFRPTHFITIIDEKKREPTNYRVLYGFSELEAQMALVEHRRIPERITFGKWLYMVPKSIVDKI